jgi:hypothetical protein
MEAMSVTDPAKWTCPSCHRTVCVYASEPDQRCAIAAMQKRHAAAHKEVAMVLARLGLPNPLRPPRRQPGRKTA